MKLSSIKSVRFLLVMVIFLLAISRVAAENLSCLLTIDKHTFLPCEYIMIGIEVKNNSRHVLEVSFPSLQYPSVFHLRVVDESGNLYEYHGEPGYGAPYKSRLRPGETTGQQNSLSGWYGQRDPENRLFACLPKGRYFVKASYRPSDQDSSIVSNTIRFEVVEPSGKESKAHDLWMQAERVIRREDARKLNLLTQLIETYQTSAYRPAAIEQLIFGLVTVGDTAKARSYLQKMLLDYPNSMLAWEGVVRYSWRMPDEQKPALYRELMNEVSGTRVGTEISKRLTR